jgi:hypothetical protein
MAEWRITEEIPVREHIERLDYERCAALHNYIVERGWVERGLELADLDRTTWWECYQSDINFAQDIQGLDASVISFLKLAWHGFARDSSVPTHAFHRVNARLCTPKELWRHPLPDGTKDSSDKRQFVVLYMASWQLSPGHPLGIILEQEDFTAMQHISMEDSMVTLNGRQGWVNLEEILDSFLEMIDQGKVNAVDDSYRGTQEKISDWIMPSYTEQDLEDSVEALDILVATIEARMPSPPLEDSFERGFIDLDAPETSKVFPLGTFARRFLERARRPRFTYLAPGLQLAQTQPFASIAISEDMLRPILLLQGSDYAFHDTIKTPWGEDYEIFPFHRDFQTIKHYPSGLYLTETEPYNTNPFEDGCKLLLPFTIGENGWARTSDSALFGEEKHSHSEVVEPTPTSWELFQLGFNHFIKNHDVQLKHVLWQWNDLVEAGLWEVDDNGVIGGIEKWKEADTEERWGNYQMSMSW